MSCFVLQNISTLTFSLQLPKLLDFPLFAPNWFQNLWQFDFPFSRWGFWTWSRNAYVFLFSLWGPPSWGLCSHLPDRAEPPQHERGGGINFLKDRGLKDHTADITASCRQISVVQIFTPHIANRRPAISETQTIAQRKPSFLRAQSKQQKPSLGHFLGLTRPCVGKFSIV